MSERVAEIALCRGGWFVCDESRVGWSGPWRTKEAAEAARVGDYARAHEIERQPK